MNMKRLSKLLTGCLACLIVAGTTLPAGALSLTVDGAERTAEAKAVLLGDTTYVSLRSVAAMLDPNAQVSWSEGVASVTSEQLDLTACPGEQYLQVNGRCLYIKDSVKLINGSTMVPIRVLAAAMGGTVDWVQNGEKVLVSSGESGPEQANYDKNDLYWLSRIISAESRGEPLAGKIAVGNVVLNRVASDEFPNTIYGVIFDDRWGGQFTPAQNGTIYDEPTQESVVAAKLCLEGADEAGESLYFLAPSLTQNHWIMDNQTYVTTIGCHWFYR
jgi:N-acetylmuramoyl-L-alanine amidase